MSTQWIDFVYSFLEEQRNLACQSVLNSKTVCHGFSFCVGWSVKHRWKKQNPHLTHCLPLSLPDPCRSHFGSSQLRCRVGVGCSLARLSGPLLTSWADSPCQHFPWELDSYMAFLDKRNFTRLPLFSKMPLSWIFQTIPLSSNPTLIYIPIVFIIISSQE